MNHGLHCVSFPPTFKYCNLEKEINIFKPKEDPKTYRIHMAFLLGYLDSKDEMRLFSLLSCLQVLQSAPAEQFLWIITHVLTFSDTAVFEIFTLWPQPAPHSPESSFHKLISLLTKMWPESSIWSVIGFLSGLHKKLFLSLQRKTHNSYSVFTRLSLLLYPSFISTVVKSIVLGIIS